MNHQAIQEQLALYRYLGAAEREQVDRHVVACAECAGRLHDYRAMDHDLAALRLPRPDRRVRERFYQSIATGHRSAVGNSLRQVSRALSVAAGAGAVLLVILALWATFQAMNHSTAPAGRPTSPAPGGGTVIEWTRQAGQGCQTASIDQSAKATFGLCGEQKRTAELLTQRPEELVYLARHYQPFEADTPAGHIKLAGEGSSVATPAEQRAVAEWAALVYQESEMGRGGASWGLALAIVQEGSNACSQIQIEFYGRAFGQDCTKGLYPLNPRWLTPEEDEMLFGLLDHFSSVEMEWQEGNAPVRLVFSGWGSTAPTDADKARIRALAETAYARLRDATPISAVTPAPAEENPYPLTLGATWVYQSTRYEGFNTGPVMTGTTTITETVVDVKTDPAFSAARIRRETGDEMPVAGPADLQQQLLRRASSSEYWLVYQGNRLYKQADSPDPSNLKENDSLELVWPLTADEKWVWQPASTPDKPLAQGVFRQVMQVKTLDSVIGSLADCAMIKDGWNTDTAWGWFCPGIGWVERQSDHNGTPYGSHEVLIKFLPGSGGAMQVTPTPVPTPVASVGAIPALAKFMQARIGRDEAAVLALLTNDLSAKVKSGQVQGPVMQVTNPCWYRYEITQSSPADASTIIARVRVYQHFWSGDNGGGPPRSWEQQITLVNTPAGWLVDALGQAENDREELGEPHGPTQSACGASQSATPAGADTRPYAIAWSPSGNTIGVGTSSGIVLYDLNTGSPARTLDQGEASGALAWAPDSSRLASISGEGVVKLWDLKSGNLLNKLNESGASFESIAFSPDGKYLAGGIRGGALKVWDASGENLIKTFLGPNTTVPGLVFTPDSGQIVATYGNDKVRVWTVADGAMREINISGFITVLSPDGTHAAVVDQSGAGKIHIWDLVNVQLPVTINLSQVSTFLFSSNSGMLAVKDRYHVTMYDIVAGKPLGVLLPDALATSRLLAFSPDGKKVAAVSVDGSLLIVDWQLGAAPADAAPNGWPTYRNDQGGFSIQYPPTWKFSELPDQNAGLLRGVHIEGAEGGIELYWGQGFGGACAPDGGGYTTVKGAQGDLSTCYSKGADGVEQWNQISRPNGKPGFQARAWTADGSAASDAMLRLVIATLTFY